MFMKHLLSAGHVSGPCEETLFAETAYTHGMGMNRKAPSPLSSALAAHEEYLGLKKKKNPIQAPSFCLIDKVGEPRHQDFFGGVLK